MNHYGYQQAGNGCVIIIHGQNREEVESDFVGFWNYHATDGNFIWLNDGVLGNYVGYFWTTFAKIKQCMVKRFLSKILNSTPMKYKNQKGGAIREAKDKAEQFMNHLERESLMPLNVKSKETKSSFLSEFSYYGPTLEELFLPLD